VYAPVTDPGPGVDAAGRAVIDPTKNVLQLVQAAVERLDDLRTAEATHVRELGALRDQHYRELRAAEAKRIDAIRTVDVNAVQRAAEVAAAQAATLAAQVAASAEAMRTQVSTAADAAAASQAAALAPIQTAIDELRRALYETQGSKAQVVERQAAGANTGLWLTIAIASVGLVIAAVMIAIAVHG
jgi:hypothetical protein